MPQGSRTSEPLLSVPQFISDSKSFRDYDHNGWPEIKDNPITKVGVFQYSGRQIADAENSQNLDLNKLYNVYRPAEELASPETIESFKLTPFIDEHAMLGSAKDGKTPPEEYGIDGILGQDVRFDPNTNYLVANLKIFSDSAINSIDVEGKKEISAGYYCDFVKESGIYEGEHYDFVQRNIRGNHTARVWEGRSGPDISVLDSMKFTFDAKELLMTDKELMAMDAEEKEEKAEAKDAEGEYLKFLNKADVEDEDVDEEAMDEDDSDEDPPAMDEDTEKEKGDTSKAKSMDSKAKARAMDAKAFFVEFAKRNELAEKLSQHIGTFDHASKTLDEVAKYGIQKLKLSCEKGHEKSFLAGYMEGAKAKAIAPTSFAGDSRIESTSIDAYLKDKE